MVTELFQIPDYQSGYEWKQDQLLDFWDDILNLQEDRYHTRGGYVSEIYKIYNERNLREVRI